MYYILYLSSLCRRRRWPDPHYDTVDYGSGYACKVHVNYRDYQAETLYQTEELAKEAAAMNAYLICRNLSASEGLAAAAANSNSGSSGRRSSGGSTSSSSSSGPGTVNGSQYARMMQYTQHGVSVGSGGWVSGDA